MPAFFHAPVKAGARLCSTEAARAARVRHAGGAIQRPRAIF